MADVQIHQGKSRLFTLTPTLDGSPFPDGATSPVLASSNSTVFEVTPDLGGDPFKCIGKLLVVDNTFLTWQFQVPSGATISGVVSIEGVANPVPPEANGGTVTAGDEF